MKRLLSLLCFISVLIVIGGVSAQTAERPLIMPVEGAPGPGTWLFGQPYGNTVGAYNFGTAWYSAGEGLHFGIDLSMPCGTRLVAAADGEVLFVDNLSFGSAPHNLLIRHDGAGVVALYGHLLQRSDLQPGQRVTQGQFVGLSGDPDLTCDSRPHLHYELRSLNYGTTYNPVSYIDAAWDSLAIIGGFSYPFFALDLNNARRWLSLDDQPDVVFGGRRLNDYANVYPAPGNRRPLPSATLDRSLPAPEGSWRLRTLAEPDCCWLHLWHPTDPNRLYVLDGAANQRATISVWDAASGQPVADAGTDMPYFSPDGNYEIYQVGSYISLRDTRDGSVRPLFTGGVIPSISPDSQHLLWITRSGANVPGQADLAATIWMSDLTGENGQVVLSDVGLGAQWLDSDRLLVSQPAPDDSRRLSILTPQRWRQRRPGDLEQHARHERRTWGRPPGLLPELPGEPGSQRHVSHRDSARRISPEAGLVRRLPLARCPQPVLPPLHARDR